MAEESIAIKLDETGIVVCPGKDSGDEIGGFEPISEAREWKLYQLSGFSPFRILEKGPDAKRLPIVGQRVILQPCRPLDVVQSREHHLKSSIGFIHQAFKP
jgi:hypothetical protein